MTIVLTSKEAQAIYDYYLGDPVPEILKEYGSEKYLDCGFCAYPDEGEFDSEKGAMYDFPIELIVDGVTYKAHGGYYHQGDYRFNYDLTFYQETVYGVVKLEANYADEFDTDSLWFTNKEDYEEFIDDLEARELSKDAEIYFGSNQFIVMDAREILNSLSFHKLEESTYDEMVRLLGDTYGLLNIPELADNYEYSND